MCATVCLLKPIAQDKALKTEDSILSSGEDRFYFFVYLRIRMFLRSKTKKKSNQVRNLRALWACVFAFHWTSESKVMAGQLKPASQFPSQFLCFLLLYACSSVCLHVVCEEINNAPSITLVNTTSPSPRRFRSVGDRQRFGIESKRSVSKDEGLPFPTPVHSVGH